jgi:hypothetical protein
MNRVIAVSMFLFLFSMVYTQAYPESVIATAEEWLKERFEELYSIPSDLDKENLNQEILDTFESVLHNPIVFGYPFDSLRRIGKVYSPDHKIQLITWNIPASDGTNTCYGFIQCKQKRKKPCLVFRLIDRSGEISNPETSILDPNHWWGALYYDILLNRSKGSRLYTLIGYSPYNRYSNKKVLDVITFDQDRQPSFGIPVFRAEETIYCRQIFEYSQDVVMNLRYEPGHKMIICDHLTPIEPAFEGNYRFYAPDGSYDGFKFRKGVWEYQSDIDVRNP